MRYVSKNRALKWFSFDWKLSNKFFDAVESLFSPILLLLSCYFVH